MAWFKFPHKLQCEVFHIIYCKPFFPVPVPFKLFLNKPLDGFPSWRTCRHEETGHQWPGQGGLPDARSVEGREEVRQEDAERATQSVHQRVPQETDCHDHPTIASIWRQRHVLLRPALLRDVRRAEMRNKKKSKYCSQWGLLSVTEYRNKVQALPIGPRSHSPWTSRGPCTMRSNLNKFEVWTCPGVSPVRGTVAGTLYRTSPPHNPHFQTGSLSRLKYFLPATLLVGGNEVASLHPGWFSVTMTLPLCPRVSVLEEQLRLFLGVPFGWRHLSFYFTVTCGERCLWWRRHLVCEGIVFFLPVAHGNGRFRLTSGSTHDATRSWKEEKNACLGCVIK